MRVLLIFPPDVHAIDPFKKANAVHSPWIIKFPIGLGYLAAILEKDAFEISIYNACSEKNITFEMIKEKIIDYNPDVIGIAVVYTALAKTSVKIAQIAKETNPRIIVVAGGPHATYDYENLLNNYPVDFVILGEGEISFLELLNKLRNNDNDFESVKGIAFLRDRVCITEKRFPIENLDSLPYPARHLVDFRKCIKNELLPNAVSIMTSRGCSHSCAFCSLTHFFRRWRPRRPQNVIDEMKYLLKAYENIKSFQFYDDNFTFNQERVIELCELIIKNRLQKYKWNCLARVDQVNFDMLKLMKRSGCEKVSFGVESGSPQILMNIHKGISLEQVKEAFKLTSEVGMESLAFFMIGNPGETQETINQSIRFAKSLKSTSTLWSIAEVYPGTEFERKITRPDFIKYIYEPEIENPCPFTHPCVPVFEQPGLNREKLKIVHKSIMKKFLIHHSIKNFTTYFKYFIRSPINGLMHLLLIFRRTKA
jgi:anaerobic magnesium-protoporphyrin IX monomethyl ester cyclase